LKNLAATGANWVILNVQVWQETISSTNITLAQYATASDEALRHMIELGHSLGIRVALQPMVALSQDPTHVWIHIGTSYSTETQWQEWFASYREMIMHYATLAQNAGADMFFIGHELTGTVHREADWRRVAQEVRQVYKGPIIYEATTNYVPLVPLSLTDEDLQIKWWDALDYIGVLGYFPLTNKNNPTVEELKIAWVEKGYVSRFEGLWQKFQKPIIISEIGYGSVDGTNRSPLNNLYESLPLDLQEQADCYQAALEVLWGRPWLKGIFWFQWPAIPVWWPPDRMIKSSVPCGKPAEEIIKRFYLSQ